MTLPNGVATLENGLVASGLPAPQNLIHGERILDIGAGLRPMPWYKAAAHVCAEPHGPYADRLTAAGYNTWRVTASQALRLASTGEFDVIYLLDVIEHMTREDGEKVLKLAQAREPKQIVVFTPIGFLPQEGDAWGLGGEEWQRHRSGWTQADFLGWYTETWGHQQFFAIWTAP